MNLGECPFIRSKILDFTWWMDGGHCVYLEKERGDYTYSVSGQLDHIS